MHLIANDVAQSGVFAVEPVVDGGKLSVVVADDQDNLVVFHPGETGGGGGGSNQLGMMRPARVRLRCVADFHLGAAVSHFVGAPLVPPPRALLSSKASRKDEDSEEEDGAAGAAAAAAAELAARRDGAFFGGLDGSAGAMIPVDEMVFRRLYKLQVSDPQRVNERTNERTSERGIYLFHFPASCPISRESKNLISSAI